MSLVYPLKPAENQMDIYALFSEPSQFNLNINTVMVEIMRNETRLQFSLLVEYRFCILNNKTNKKSVYKQ